MQNQAKQKYWLRQWWRSRRFLWQKRRRFGVIFGMLVVLVLAIARPASSSVSEALLLTVYNHEIGVSTHYIGACEGNVDFDPADFEDLNINTYRIYSGISRWEAE